MDDDFEFGDIFLPDDYEPNLRVIGPPSAPTVTLPDQGFDYLNVLTRKPSGVSDQSSINHGRLDARNDSVYAHDGIAPVDEKAEQPPACKMYIIDRSEGAGQCINVGQIFLYTGHTLIERMNEGQPPVVYGEGVTVEDLKYTIVTLSEGLGVPLLDSDKLIINNGNIDSIKKLLEVKSVPFSTAFLVNKQNLIKYINSANMVGNVDRYVDVSNEGVFRRTA